MVQRLRAPGEDDCDPFEVALRPNLDEEEKTELAELAEVTG
jgi:hypothetical protein